MSDTDAETTVDDVKSRLDRAKGREREEALELLRSAKADLEALAEDGAADDETVDALSTRVDQRIREVERRDEYATDDMGAAMDPDEDTAP